MHNEHVLSIMQKQKLWSVATIGNFSGLTFADKLQVFRRSDLTIETSLCYGA